MAGCRMHPQSEGLVEAMETFGGTQPPDLPAIRQEWVNLTGTPVPKPRSDPPTMATMLKAAKGNLTATAGADNFVTGLILHMPRAQQEVMLAGIRAMWESGRLLPSLTDGVLALLGVA